MNNRVLTFIILLINYMWSIAQDSHFSNFNTALLYSDPSAISVHMNPQATLSYRNQWPGFQSAFVTYSACYIQPFNQFNSTVGIQLIHDIQGDGVFSKSLFSGIYSYSVKASDFVKLSAGLQISYIHRKVNPVKLQFESEMTGSGNISYDLGFEKYKSNFIDFSLGLSAYLGKYFVSGFAVQHITKPIETSGSEELGSLNHRIIGYSSGYINLKNSSFQNIVLKPGILFQKQGLYNEFLYGSSLIIKPFEFGLWARNDIKFSFDALIVSLGFAHEAYSFNYCYDANMKSMQIFSTGIGAHEVTFLYNFKYKEKRKRWAQ